MINPEAANKKTTIPHFGLVIPCADVAKSFPFYRILAFLQKNPHVALALVNDGSTDRTAAVLIGLQLEAPQQVFLLHLPVKVGKAEAIRQGMLALNGRLQLQHIGYVENFSQPQEWLRLAEYGARQPQLGVIMASPLRASMGFMPFPGWKKIKYLFQRLKRQSLFEKSFWGNHWPANVFHHKLVPFLFEEPFAVQQSFEWEWMQRLQKKFGANAMVGGVKEFSLSSR